MWVIILIIAVVVIVVLISKSQGTKQESALAKLMSIDPKMGPTAKGIYVGWALGVSQANKTVYINNKDTIVEIPFSQLVGIDIELDPVKSGIYTQYSLCNLIIHYTSGEMRFYAAKGDADQIRKALMPIIEQKVQLHNSAITKTAGKKAKMIEVTVIGQSQPSITPHRVKAYIDNNVLRLEEIATLDNIKFHGFSASVSLSAIVAFEQIGNVHYTTDVSGGGSSLTGAIIGGVIAGGAGAIIGSRQEVTSSTRKIDDRATVLKYRRGEQILQILFMYDDYYLLRDLIK